MPSRPNHWKSSGPLSFRNRSFGRSPALYLDAFTLISSWMGDRQQQHGAAPAYGYPWSHPMIRGNGHRVHQDRSYGSWGSALANSNSPTSYWPNAMNDTTEPRRHSSGGQYSTGLLEAYPYLQVPDDQTGVFPIPSSFYQGTTSQLSTADLHTHYIVSSPRGRPQDLVGGCERPYTRETDSEEPPYPDQWEPVRNVSYGITNHNSQSSAWGTRTPPSEHVRASGPATQVLPSPRTPDFPASSWDCPSAIGGLDFLADPVDNHQMSELVSQVDVNHFPSLSQDSNPFIRRPTGQSPGYAVSPHGFPEVPVPGEPPVTFPFSSESEPKSGVQQSGDHLNRESIQASDSQKCQKSDDSFKPRKQRALSPDGKRHAKAVRNAGGACDICKRKKTKARISSVRVHVWQHAHTKSQCTHNRVAENLVNDSYP